MKKQSDVYYVSPRIDDDIDAEVVIPIVDEQEDGAIYSKWIHRSALIGGALGAAANGLVVYAAVAGYISFPLLYPMGAAGIAVAVSTAAGVGASLGALLGSLIALFVMFEC